MVDVTELQPHQRAWTLDDTPCPRCGRVGFVMGYQLIDVETGKHQHTHYVCTAWPYPDPKCGWDGWRADQKEVEPQHKLDEEFAQRVDEMLLAKSFTLDRRKEINLMLHRAAGCCLSAKG